MKTAKPNGGGSSGFSFWCRRRIDAAKAAPYEALAVGIDVRLYSFRHRSVNTISRAALSDKIDIPG
jgi:hypothetical protein